MAKSDYLDPRWQKFQLKRLELSKWKCDVCGTTTEKLNVHHRFYISKRKPWEYLPETTMVVCDECHEIQHEFLSDFENLGAHGWEHVVADTLEGRRKYKLKREKAGLATK